ncbi:hypothetical protein GCM10027037_31620 [Mucilaginibacter koreensis]
MNAIDLSIIEQNRKKLCEDLGLPYDINEQDWGIVNADGTRTHEFIEYYRNAFSTYIYYDLYELIVASYNEALQANIYDKELQESFLKVVEDALKNEYLLFLSQHWAKYEDDEFWPVGSLLKEHLQQF